MIKFLYQIKKAAKNRLNSNFKIKKTIHHHQRKMKLVFKNCEGLNNTIRVGENCNIDGLSIIIKGNNNLIEIGQNVRFNKVSSIWLEGDNLITKIGNNCTFEGVHLANAENNIRLIIGADCMFSYGIEIRTSDSHSIIDNSFERQRLNYAKDVIIGDHCWVGSNVTILKGVDLKSNTVIATASVVTKSFNHGNCIIAGNPAVVKKTDISWSRERL